MAANEKRYKVLLKRRSEETAKAMLYYLENKEFEKEYKHKKEFILKVLEQYCPIEEGTKDIDIRMIPAQLCDKIIIKSDEDRFKEAKIRTEKLVSEMDEIWGINGD